VGDNFSLLFVAAVIFLPMFRNNMTERLCQGRIVKQWLFADFTLKNIRQ
jgi:hypothetical protein